MSSASTVADVDRILRAEGVETSPPRPSVGDWLAELVGRFFEALDGLLPGSFDLSFLERPLLWGLLILSVVALGVLVHRALARRPSNSGIDSERPSTDRPASTAAEIDWRAVLRASLDAGDLPRALEATWWLLLSGLGQTAGERARRETGRRALRAAGRLDLVPLVHRLERATYGPETLERQRVEALAREVEEAFL